jgi:hypothetical protein
LARAYDVKPKGTYRIQYEALNQVLDDGPEGGFDEWWREQKTGNLVPKAEVRNAWRCPMKSGSARS